jgi:predicted transposase/invertase (TIGR01784 family)
MRDERQPNVSLGNILQMNLIELNKADRLGLPPGPLRAWITFFKHWQDEITMATVTHEPVKQAMNRIRTLSADEEARRLAFVRERALHDEVSFLNEAKREGRDEGRKEGREEARNETARNLIAMNLLTDEQIAAASGLPAEVVKSLRER